MPIALRGTSQTGAAGNGGDVTLTFDAVTPPLEDDIVIVSGGHGDATTTLAAPGTGYTQLAINTGSAPIWGVWYKRMGATPDTSVVCSGGGDGTDAVCYISQTFSGVDTTTAIDVTTTVAGPTTSTNPNAPSITPVTANAFVVAMAGSNVRDTSPGTVSGYSDNQNTNRNDTNDITVAAAYIDAGAVDAEDPAAWGTWASGTWYAASVALRPAGGGSDTEIIPPAANLQLSTTAPVLTCGGNAAVRFDGTSDRVDMGDVHSFTGTVPFTVELRMIYDSTQPGSSFSRLVSKQDDTGIENGWRLTSDKSAGTIILARVLNDAQTSASQTFSEDTVHHVAGVYDSTDLQVFIDGVGGTKVGDTTSITSAAWPLTIAAQSEVQTTSELAGAIDELRIWNYARTSAEINRDKDIRLQGSEEGLVGYWRFDEGTGTNAGDDGSGGNDGTLEGDPVWTWEMPALTGDGIEIPSANLQLTTTAPGSFPLQNGADFDGTADWLDASTLSGADSTEVSFVNFFKPTTGMGTDQRWFQGEGGHTLVKITGASGGFYKAVIRWRQNTGDVVVEVETDYIFAEDAWNVVFFSYDSTTQTVHVWNHNADIDDGAYGLRTLTTGTIGLDFQHAVGAATSGSNKYTGGIGPLWFTNEFIDFSSSANRDKFLDADGRPNLVGIGADGSIPTGTQPLYWLWDVFSSYHTNDGSAGDFTVNGSLTDEGTGPLVSLSSNVSIIIPAANLQLSATAPTLGHGISPAAAQLELSTTAPSLFSGILDELSATSLVALSTARRLLNSHSGNLIRLRKDGGAPGELDFGFDENGDLDTAAIATWLSSDNAFVVTVYDQSGNGYDVTQATAADQPPYVASDSAFNNKPVANFDGSTDHLEHTALPKANVVGDISHCSVISINTGFASDTTTVEISGGPDETEAENILLLYLMYSGIDLTYFHEYGVSGANESNAFTATDLTADQAYVHHTVRDITANTVDLYIDNVAETQFGYTNDPTNTSTNVTHTIGARITGTATGLITGAEWVLFDSPISSGDRTTLADDQISYYGLAAAANVSIIIPAANLQLSATALSVDLGISPAAANLQLSTTSPTRSLGIGRIPDAAQLQLDSTAPLLSQGYVREPAAAQLQLSTTAASISVPVGIEIPAANLALSTTASVVTIGYSIEIPAANLQLSTTAAALLTPVGISIPAADLALSSTAPSIALDKQIIIPAANVQLSSTASTVEIGRDLTIPAAQLQLSTSAPTVLTPIAIEVPAANLTISTTAPLINFGFEIEVPAANLQLSTTAPIVETPVGVTIPAANLALSTTAPVLTPGQVRIPPGAQLQLSSTAPIIAIEAVGSNVEIIIPAAQLQLSTTALFSGLGILPAAANLQLSTTVPTLTPGQGRIPDAAQLQISSSIPTIELDKELIIPAAQLQLSTSIPLVATPVGIEVPAAQLQLSTTAASINFGFDIEIPAAQLQLSTAAATILTPVGITIPAADLTLSSTAPSVSVPVGIEVPAAQLTLSTSIPLLSQGLGRIPPAAQLQLSTTAPTLATPIGVTVPAANLELSATIPLLSQGYGRTPPAANLQLSSTAPTIAIEATTIDISPPAAQLTLSATAPTILTPISISPPAAQLQLNATAPTILTPIAISPPAAQLALSTSALTILTPINISPPAAQLQLSTTALTIEGTFIYEESTTDAATLTATFADSGRFAVVWSAVDASGSSIWTPVPTE